MVRPASGQRRKRSRGLFGSCQSDPEASTKRASLRANLCSTSWHQQQDGFTARCSVCCAVRADDRLLRALVRFRGGVFFKGKRGAQLAPLNREALGIGPLNR